MQVKYVMWLKLSLKCSIVSFCWWQPYYNFKKGLQISNLYKFKILVISIILISDGWQGRKRENVISVFKLIGLQMML